MKKLLAVLALFIVTVATLHGQAPFRVFTSPKMPSRDSLDRMSLRVAWTTRVAVHGQRDGIFSIQLIPDQKPQIIVQTWKGAVYLFDAETGDLVWKNVNVNQDWWPPQSAGFNSQAIFVTRKNTIHVLNREDGRQRVFTYDPVKKLIDFGRELNFTPNAALVGEDGAVYLPMGDRIQAFKVPDYLRYDEVRIEAVKLQRDHALREDKKDGKEVKKDEYVEKKSPTKKDDLSRIVFDSPPLEFAWGYAFPDRLITSPPFVSNTSLSFVTTDGTLFSFVRTGEGARADRAVQFQTTGKVLAPPGYHNLSFAHKDKLVFEPTAYIGSLDFSVYAVHAETGRLFWRHLSGSPILQKPEVNDDHVFVVPERVGLRCLRRETGAELWTNREATRFLAANRQYVYALDQVGRFFVLDARRGTTLARMDMAEWNIQIANEWNDRLYFAANDGQILCLRHSGLAKPLIMKTDDAPLRRQREKEEKELKEKKKEEEKKDDKEKEKAAVPRRGFDISKRIESFPSLSVSEGASAALRWRSGSDQLISTLADR